MAEGREEASTQSAFLQGRPIAAAAGRPPPAARRLTPAAFPLLTQPPPAAESRYSDPAPPAFKGLARPAVPLHARTKSAAPLPASPDEWAIPTAPAYASEEPSLQAEAYAGLLRFLSTYNRSTVGEADSPACPFNAARPATATAVWAEGTLSLDLELSVAEVVALVHPAPLAAPLALAPLTAASLARSAAADAAASVARGARAASVQAAAASRKAAAATRKAAAATARGCRAAARALAGRARACVAPRVES